VERFRVAPVERVIEPRRSAMAGFKINFLAGLLIGAGLAVVAPVAGADLIAGLTVPSPPASAGTPATGTVQQTVVPQNVNRAAKSNRLHPSQKATGDTRPKLPKILEGCDPAFSPLSRGAASNFSSRCLS
jgi:hypothetical protein